MSRGFAVIFMVFVVGYSTAQKPLAWDLFEKAVFAEETLGDFDAAKEIYTQLAADSQLPDSLRAKSLYRIAWHYQKTGSPELAVVIWGQLVQEFPEERVLIARANQYLPAEMRKSILGPIPWENGEFLIYHEYRDSDKAYMGVTANWVYREREMGRAVLRTMVNRVCERFPGMGSVISDLEDFSSIRAEFNSPQVGSADLRIQADVLDVSVFRNGRTFARSIPLNRRIYFHNQGFHHVRRMPIEKGFQFNYPIYSEALGVLLDMTVNLTEIEQIEVPAGRFECVRAETPQNLAYWVSTDPRHLIVRIKFMGQTSDLVHISQKTPGRQTVLESSQYGYTFPLPADWWFHRLAPKTADELDAVELVSGDGIAGGRLSVRNLGDETTAGPHGTEMAQLKARVMARGGRIGDWKEIKVSGYPGVTFASRGSDQSAETKRRHLMVLKDGWVFDLFLHVWADRDETRGPELAAILARFQLEKSF